MISKLTVEDHRQLCIFSLRREGVLRDGYSTSWVWRDPETLEETGRIGLRVSASALHLDYKARWGMGDWQDVSDTIFLSKTRPAKGGFRWWFVCPGCNTRRAQLYLHTVFRCRACLGLRYSSQLEALYDRDLRRLFKRRQRLGGYGGTYEPFPAKPKWMRWATYERLYGEDMDDLVSIDRHTLAFLERLDNKR